MVTPCKNSLDSLVSLHNSYLKVDIWRFLVQSNTYSFQFLFEKSSRGGREREKERERVRERERENTETESKEKKGEREKTYRHSQKDRDKKIVGQTEYGQTEGKEDSPVCACVCVCVCVVSLPHTNITNWQKEYRSLGKANTITQSPAQLARDRKQMFTAAGVLTRGRLWSTCTPNTKCVQLQ